MSRFWLTYRRKFDSRLLGVVIIDSTSIAQARMCAAADGADEGREFVNGVEMEPDHAALVPATAIGCMLSSNEAHELIDRFERAPRAASVKRRTGQRTERLRWWRKIRHTEVLKRSRNLSERLRSAPVVARALAGSVTLLKLVGDTIEPILGSGDARRGILFGIGAFVLLGVLSLLLWQPNTFSPGQTIIVAVLVMVSVIAMFVMDLLD